MKNNILIGYILLVFALLLIPITNASSLIFVVTSIYVIAQNILVYQNSIRKIAGEYQLRIQRKQYQPIIIVIAIGLMGFYSYKQDWVFTASVCLLLFGYLSSIFIINKYKPIVSVIQGTKILLLQSKLIEHSISDIQSVNRDEFSRITTIVFTNATEIQLSPKSFHEQDIDAFVALILSKSNETLPYK